MISLKAALKGMPAARVFVLLPIGGKDCTIEIIGVHSCSIGRGEIVLRVAGGKHFPSHSNNPEKTQLTEAEWEARVEDMKDLHDGQ